MGLSTLLLPGLAGLGAIALLGIPGAIAQTSRPSIFNEAPYNRTVRPAPGPTPLLQPNRLPVATITPVNGKVNVKLINKTGTVVVYQVIGGTAQRQLQGRSEVNLSELSTPVNLTFYRPDRGFLIVTLQTPSTPGTLEVTLTETANPDAGRSAMSIESSGGVFLD